MLLSFLLGLLFGIGFIVSQMANPVKVQNFLDIAGHWDPSLLFVMGSALLLFIPCYFLWLKKLKKPLCHHQFYLPTKNSIDKKLIIGATIFGIGWGIAGICPGPALVNLTSFDPKIIGFIIMMLFGIQLAKRV